MTFNASTAVTFLGVLGIAATSTLSMADSAYSASFIGPKAQVIGEVSIAGSRVISKVIAPGITSFDFTNIGGRVNPVGTGQFLTTDGEGIFSAFNPSNGIVRGTIKDLPNFGTGSISNFLSFGSFTFDLYKIAPSIQTLNGSQALVSFAVEGMFFKDKGKTTEESYKGFGTFGAEITFPVSTSPSGRIRNFKEFLTFLNTPGRSITVQSWSANLQAVPEPFTMLGVGTAVGLGTFFKRKTAKKQDK